MLYLLNSAVIATPGLYRYTVLGRDEAAYLVGEAASRGTLVSAIGHEGTARVVSEILGVEIHPNRVFVVLNPGEKAVVFRITTRLPEGKVLTAEELRQVPYELGLLERVE